MGAEESPLCIGAKPLLPLLLPDPRNPYPEKAAGLFLYLPPTEFARLM